MKTSNVLSYIVLIVSLFACVEETRDTEQAAEEKNEAMSVETEAKTFPAFDWQAHRGGRGRRPENTIPAFMHALTYPEVTTLELDLAVSKDEWLIVSHEPWMSSAICQDPEGKEIPEADERKHNIYELTYSEISKYDCGSKLNQRFPYQRQMVAHKPRLRDVVLTAERQLKVKGRKMYYNIEIKSSPEGDEQFHPAPRRFAELLLSELEHLEIKDRATVQSFDPRALEAVHELDATLTTAWLIENEDGFEANMERLSYQPEIYSPYHVLVDEPLLEKAHQRDMLVIPWTVNDTTRMKELIALGVDGIITDYPNLIEEVVKE
ncbi:MAG: glycerophosphodiester phosphodiesterase family protein [Bacteroidota bacterium]